ALPNSPMWLRGKRSIELDLRSAPRRLEAARLAKGGYVVVTPLSNTQAQSFGLEYEGLAADNPSLVYCRVSGFGPRGPYAGYPGYEGLVAATSGRRQAFTGLTNQ